MGKEPLWDFLASSWRDHLAIYVVATWSGLITSLHRSMSGKRRFSWAVLGADVLLSGLAGILTYWTCQAIAIEPPWTAIAAGIAGHSAPRTLWLLERQLRQRLGGGNSNGADRDSADDANG